MSKAQVATRNRDIHSRNLRIGIKIMTVGVATQEDCVEGESSGLKIPPKIVCQKLS